MPQAGGVAVDTDIRGRGGFSLLLGEWRNTLGIFESGDSASRRVAVVAITTVTSGVAYKGARLKAEENRSRASALSTRRFSSAFRRAPS